MKTNFYIYAAFSLILSSCQQKNDKKADVQPSKFCLNQELKKSTEISELKEQDIREQLTLSGKIEYNENDLVAYKSLLQGIVESVHFELGDYVKKGQVLATVKSNEVLDLMQQKRYHENQVVLASKQIKTKTELLKDGMASQPEVTAAEHELQAAQIEVDKINASLALYRAVGNGLFQILAPKNGYIVQKNMSIGQSILVDSQDSFFSISNLKQVWVMVNIYANNLQYIKEGDVVKVRTIAFPDRNYEGKIDKIYRVFDANEHVLKARVILDNEDLQLMPGLSADIIIDKNNILGKAFAIPNSAKIFENNKEFVVVYKDDCHLETRRITTIGQNEEFTFVAEKFAPQEQVIKRNALMIYEELTK